MLGWLKRKLAGTAAKVAGKEFGMGRIGQLLKDNAKTVSAGFVAIAAWAWQQECGTVFGFDILALIQRYLPSVICDQIQHLLLMVAAFLAGAGVQDPEEWLVNLRKKAPAKLVAPVPVPPGK